MGEDGRIDVGEEGLAGREASRAARLHGVEQGAVGGMGDRTRGAREDRQTYRRQPNGRV